jgi:hypothetical protein
VIAGTAGALFVAYLLFPPIWSAISFNFRGYKGTTVDMFRCKFFVLVWLHKTNGKSLCQTTFFFG